MYRAAHGTLLLFTAKKTANNSTGLFPARCGIVGGRWTLSARWWDKVGASSTTIAWCGGAPPIPMGGFSAFLSGGLIVEVRNYSHLAGLTLGRWYFHIIQRAVNA